ncbi:MAG TPA: hypothetical protein VEX38_00400, partial [Fimbriimonadaceae bacterium]|nr:hypothetical protein [Fimbriimonadaceae bacterium]
MRLHSLKALGLAIGMSLGIGALVVAGQKPPAPGGKILVAIDGKASQTSVAKAVGKLGKVVEKDADSAFYVVQLEPGTKLNSALKKLRGVKGVRFALPESARQVNTASLPSVQGHIAYLKAKFDLAGGEEVEGREGETGVDFYEALEFFLADRVSGNGEIDGEHYARQIQHRNGMPEGFINSGVQQAMASNWSYMGPKNLDVPYRIYYGVKPLIGRVTSIVINPSDPNIMYVGGANGGVWKSTDAGVNWTPKSDREDFLQIGALAIDPVNPDTIYAGTGDFHGFNINRSQGILKSTNGGTTWTAIGEAQFGSTPVTAITVDPEDPNVVICTTSSRVWRSTNGGTSWSIAVDGNGTQLPTATWTDLTFSARGGIFANGPRTYWAVGSSNNVWKSVNRGATWTKVTTAPTGCVDVAASNRPGFNNAVYLLSTGSNKIWSSSDAGANWEDKTAGFPNGNSDVGSNYNWSQKTYDYHISSSYDPQNTGRGDILYVGLITIAASRDSGDTWVDLGLTYTGSAKTHNDQHSFAVHPTNPLIAFFGHDGGIFRCSYNPTTQSGTFTGLNADLGITQFYKMTVHPTNGSVMIGGTQDNASPAALGDLANWRNLPAGDGGFCDILNSNPSISYTTSQNLSVYRTSNNWATNANIDPSSNYGGDARLFIAPIVLHNSTDLLFAGTSRVWKYTGSTNTWTAISGHLNGSSLRDLETAPSHADTLYVGGTGGKVWRSTNITAASPTFTDVSTGSPSNLPNMSVTSIGVDPTQSADIIVGLVSGGGGQVWRCANTGASPRVWTNITGSGATGLPNVPVNAVARDPFDPNNTFFAGTDLGVFMTTDAGSTWTNVTEPRGLPNTMVNDLKVATDANTDNTYLYAATFGRGIWRIPLRRLEASTLSLPSTIVGGLS